MFFLKGRLLFNIFYCFCTFINKHFIYTGAYISKGKQCYNAKPLALSFLREDGNIDRAFKKCFT